MIARMKEKEKRIRVRMRKRNRITTSRTYFESEMNGITRIVDP